MTALASLAEAAKGQFEPYFDECLKFLLSLLTQYNDPCYKQFKGQVIEAATIMAASVGNDKFRPHAPVVVQAMLEIQTRQLDSKDPQRTYLLSAWQRICLLMKKEFAPYLNDVIPSLFTMATLNPEMGIQGSTATGDIIDVLSEVKPDQVDNKAGDKGKHINITTDEIEEKDVGIQMLAVFIDEMGGAFAPYVEPASKILLSLVTYEANDNIRNSVAGTLPGLIKCMKEAQPGNQVVLINMGRTFMEHLWKAMSTETETDTLICQVQAMKEIIDEVGPGFMNQEAVDALTKHIFDMYQKSDDRIKENNLMAKNEHVDDDDDKLEADDLELIKEENNNEYDLQLSLAEIIGIIFKTHKELSGPLVSELFASVLPNAIANEEKQK